MQVYRGQEFGAFGAGVRRSITWTPSSVTARTMKLPLCTSASLAAVGGLVDDQTLAELIDAAPHEDDAIFERAIRVLSNEPRAGYSLRT